MPRPRKYKLVVFVPQSHLEQVRLAVCNAGGGKIGKYEGCTFMASGIGSFRPLKGAKPYQEETGKTQRVGEARLEVTVLAPNVKKVIAAIKKVHPYEEIAYDVYKLEDF